MLHGINDEGMSRIATQLRIGQDIQIEQGAGSTEDVTSTRAVSLNFQVIYYSNGIAYLVGGGSFTEGAFFDSSTGELLSDQTSQDERVRAAVNANTESRGQTTNFGFPTMEDLTLIGKVLDSTGLSGYSG